MHAETVPIEQSIPVPKKRNRYDFPSMKVGDSMFFADETEAKSAYISARHYAKKHDPQFKLCRKKIYGGFRVWRVS